MTRLEIDTAQAYRFLKVLGYADDETAYLRALPGKGYSVNARNIERRVNDLPKYQDSDRGLYVALNGGPKDCDVTEGRVIFWEHDDRPIEEQVNMWRMKGMPEPTCQVLTGGKSVHNHLLITDRCTVEQLKELHEDLITHMESDKTIKNPSRVMRLPGAWYIQKGKEPVQSELINVTGKGYTYNELRAAIPARQPVLMAVPSQPTVEPAKAPMDASEKRLGDILRADILPLLTPEQIYDWEGHNWQFESPTKKKGCCPWHESQSGTAFYIDQKNGRWLFNCPSCNIGGDEVTYHHWLRTGDKGSKPTGRNYALAVQKLANIAGVKLPDTRPQKVATAAKQIAPVAQRVERVGRVADPDYYEVESTPDDWVFTNHFGAGEVDHVVIDDSFHKYSGKGYWARIEDSHVNRAVGQILRKLYKVKSSKNGDSRIRQFATDAYLKSTVGFCRKTLNVGQVENVNLRAFENCTVNMSTGEQIAHSREHYLTTAIAAEYHPGRECPQEFSDFVETSYGAEFLPLVRAVVSMFLDPTAPQGKFVHLMGESGSGKGTFLRFIQSLFGEKHSRSCGSFSELATPEGRHQMLTGTALCSFPDVGGFVSGLKAFYELVDNGAMSGRALYERSGYQKTWNTRFIVASVSPLQIENSGDGWDRRVIIMPTKGRGFRPDPMLERRLRDPLVRADVVSWALAMDKDERNDLLMNPGQASDRILDAQYEASLAGDPVKAFVDHCLRPSTSARKLRSTDVHTWFCAYAEAFGYQKIGEKKFAQHLKTVISRHYDPRRKANKTKGEVGDCPNNVISAGWLHIEALPELFSTSLGATVCNKVLAKEGGLYEFASFQTETDRIDRIPATPDSNVCDPTQNLENTSFSSNGSDRSDRSQHNSLYACESPCDSDSKLSLSHPPEKTLYRGNSSDPCDLSDPTAQNRYPESDSLGSHSLEKYPIHSESIRSFSVGDRVLTPNGIGTLEQLQHEEIQDGTVYVVGSTFAQWFPLEQCQHCKGE